MASDLVKLGETAGATNTLRSLTHSLDCGKEGLAVDATPEVWKPVVGYEGYYEVSNAGSVRSLDREVQQGESTRRLKGKTLRPGVGRTGKLVVALCRDGKPRTERVHRLVAIAFLGPGPIGTEVCHRDDDNWNNHVENLYWGTRSQNRADALRNGKISSALKTHCKNGHEYTPDTTGRQSNGGRFCRVCHREAGRKYKAALRARRRAGYGSPLEIEETA